MESMRFESISFDKLLSIFNRNIKIQLKLLYDNVPIINAVRLQVTKIQVDRN